VVDGKASVTLAASIFHFGKTGIPDTKAYLKSKDLSVRASQKA